MTRPRGAAVNANGRTRVLIAGGGVAALEAALALREVAADRVSIELLAPDPQFWYQPLSVAEPFGLGEFVHFELDGLAAGIGAHRTLGGLTGIDAWRHVAHTTKNAEIPYDVLLVACGALPLPAIPGAITFRGAADSEKVRHLLAEIESGEVRAVAFVIPWGAAWSLPAYELALLTAAHLETHGIGGVELTLVTPEAEPVQLFGPPASEAMRSILERAGVGLRAGSYAGGFADGQLELIPGPGLSADRVVALPRLEGAPLDGIPQTLTGFIPVDEHCRVHGVADVYAAGDITSFTVKQGGIATQQADAAAETIAAAAGVELEPHPFHPVLRGVLLTGREPRYLRRELSGAPEHEPVASYEALWWPPAKIVGRYLAPFLAQLAGAESPAQVLAAVPAGALPVEVDLDVTTVEQLTTSRFALDVDRVEGVHRVDALMSHDPVVVAPDDTLDEVAQRLVLHGGSAAVVGEHGRLVGIVTTADLVRASAARVQPHETPVRLWMTAEPVTVPPDWPASAAALLMSEYGVRHLPVEDDGRVVGMLEVEDIREVALTAGIGRRAMYDE
jgi:sulfide:quinone oxidoreductase